MHFLHEGFLFAFLLRLFHDFALLIAFRVRETVFASDFLLEFLNRRGYGVGINGLRAVSREDQIELKVISF